MSSIQNASYRANPKPPIPLPSVQNVIAIASAKGGVGKSTLATHLAAALQHMGYQVGLLDADIYGPSQPKMLGIKGEHPEIDQQRRWIPLVAYGMPTMSVGYLMAATPVLWRGPMISKVFYQLLYGTLWPSLDYLIIDLPPGTGDIALTLAQKAPLTGVVVVTTPQQVAVLQAYKGLSMFRKLHIPIIGVVENMSGYTCPACGHHQDIFSQGGGRVLSEQTQVPFLGSVALDQLMGQCSEQGEPLVFRDPQHPLSLNYQSIAQRMIDVVQKLADDVG